MVLWAAEIKSESGWRGEFEIPASFAASPSQEFQIHKPHQNHKDASAPYVSEVRIRGCRKVMRTSETEH
jgi:hypothetical protein